MVTCSNLKIKAYGKINLALDIVGKRDDGYHMLNTVMQSVSCFDLLDFTLSEGEGIELTCDLDSFPKGEDNIITKAFHAFADFTHIDFGCKTTVNVEKNLPSQAGMGGGSADAAATLRALDFMFDTRLTDEQLCSIGVTLGADVPFCITGGTRLCQGVGEIMSNLPSPDCAFVIIKPDVGISTPEAFKKYDSISNPKRCNMDVLLRYIGGGKLFGICSNLFNVLEYAADREEISHAVKELKNSGALSAIMTGSGSAVFGVFPDIASAQTAAEKLSGWSYKCVCQPVKQGWEFSNGSLFSSDIHSISSFEWHTGSLRCSRAACFSSSRFSLSFALAAMPSSGCRQAMLPSRCFSRCDLQFLNSSPISPRFKSHTLKLYRILSLCET